MVFLTHLMGLSACVPLQDQYLELTTAVPESAALYGLGERTPSNGAHL